MLALQSFGGVLWQRVRYGISMSVNAIAVLLYIISLQPYAAILSLCFLMIKGIMLAKRR
jgi:hypothetical protein